MVYIPQVLGEIIMRACVIIPTYNESKTIAGLIRQVQSSGLEVIVIDDGSTDNTADIAEAAQALLLRNVKNLGKGASLVKGYDFSLARGFDAVISMDGDGQHSCDDLAAFMRKAESSGCAIVVGNRMSSTKQMPALRVATNRFMSWLISLVTGQHIPDTQCGFRLVKKELLEKLNLSTSKYETESEILIQASRLGFKIESVPVRTIYSGQKSRIDPFVDTLRFLRFIILESFRGRRHA
ncbi:MAG: glycosyltransferase family 2 protein [Candidatus Omnitrophota bacterium]